MASLRRLRMEGTVFSWLLLPVVAYLLWGSALFLLQRRLIYPRHLLNPVPAAPADRVEAVTLSSPSGPGTAYYLPPGRAGAEPVSGGDGAPEADRAPAVLFAHGNAETARDWAMAFRMLADRGVAVLLVEYPGYGDAPGSPSQASITDVMVAAYDHLAGRPEVDARRIVGVGRSLGGGAVAALSVHRPLAGMILQSTFTSVGDFAGRFLLPRFLVRDPFDTRSTISLFQGPVLVMHGRRDQVIPYEHGRQLAAAAPEARLVSWDCGHNDCPRDWQAYVREVADFVRSASPVAPSGAGDVPDAGR